MNEIRLGIIANTGKKRVAEILPSFLTWLSKKRISFIVAEDLNNLINLDGLHSLPLDRIAKETNFILSFGGDGTFLQTARLIAPGEVPIIGVNLGGFGYLAEVSVENLRQRINDIINNNYQVQDRMMLQGSVVGREESTTHYALNDVVIDKGGFPRIIRLETSIDGVYLNTFNADGLIVATPTGSTGYSLSVGGPILEPCTDGLIINPISPHMLANRPLVVRGDSCVEITASSEIGAFQVAVDGQHVLLLKSGEKISIKRTAFVTRLAVFKDYSFYDLLRNKLHWRNQFDER